MERIPYSTLATFVDLALDVMCVVNAQGRFIYVSAAFETMFGYHPEEVIGINMIDMVAPEDMGRTRSVVTEIMEGDAKLHFENRWVHRDGSRIDMMWAARWSETEQCRVAIGRDITQRKKAESMQAALYAISEAAHATDDLMAMYGKIHRIIGELLPAQNFSVALADDANGKLNFPYHVDECPHSGAESVAGLHAEVVRDGKARLLSVGALAAHRNSLGNFAGKLPLSWVGVPLQTQGGTIGAIALKTYAGGVAYTQKDLELLQFVSTQVATTIERKKMQERLLYLAQYDKLTDLPNRGLLHDRLETALARKRRDHGRLALLYLDLNRFKQVNDTHGHAVGDALLQEVAVRLKSCVRNVDTVARIGGDEFVVLLENIRQPDHALVVAQKIRDTIGEPIVAEGVDLHVLTSIGVALYPEHGVDAQALLKHADQCMYEEKKERERFVRGPNSNVIELRKAGGSPPK
jgi:diguanylate cyclase (GGDEF)-like protein/PAS domain S-box-containing protein